MIVQVDAKSWHGKSIRSRFEEKVVVSPTSDCFLWTASKRGHNGYGGFRVNRESVRLAHNVAYEMYRGPIPDGMKVLHTCDNPLCVNPNHLFLGTQLENIKDRDVKGRCRNRFSIQQLGPASGREGGKPQ